jgi:hypothetical protein
MQYTLCFDGLILTVYCVQDCINLYPVVRALNERIHHPLLERCDERPRCEDLLNRFEWFPGPEILSTETGTILTIWATSDTKILTNTKKTQSKMRCDDRRTRGLHVHVDLFLDALTNLSHRGLFFKPECNCTWANRLMITSEEHGNVRWTPRSKQSEVASYDEEKHG